MPRVALVILAALAVAVPAAAQFEAVPGNPADRLISEPIESPRYDHARKCRRTPTPGARALQAWLEENWRGESWGIMRCERLGRRNYSLHAEGRALDWHLDTRDRAERREADRLIKLLLAPDRAGNPTALARRMGIQEIIWNCRAWWSGAERMQRYSACYERRRGRLRRKRRVNRTIAHRDHIHFGLNRKGAWLKTSFWD